MMLLSFIVTFLLKRRFTGMVYAFLVIASLVSISFFSVGVPEHRPGEIAYSSEGLGVRIIYPLPFSFPLFSTLAFNNAQIWHVDTLWYQIRLLNFVIQEDWVFAGRTLNFSWFEYVLYFSFFMLVNVVGALLGYWLSMRRSEFQTRQSTS